MITCTKAARRVLQDCRCRLTVKISQICSNLSSSTGSKPSPPRCSSAPSQSSLELPCSPPYNRREWSQTLSFGVPRGPTVEPQRRGCLNRGKSTFESSNVASYFEDFLERVEKLFTSFNQVDVGEGVLTPLENLLSFFGVLSSGEKFDVEVPDV